MSVRIEHGDCLEVLPRLAAEGVRADACVTDPPYHLTSIVKRFGKPNAKPTRDGDVYARSSAGFMGKAWDGGDVAFRPETWAKVAACLKPGAHLLAFGGTRTFHRMACAIEDAGFEIRDCVMWLYGSGFPKSHDVAKAIDKMKGGARAKIRVPADFVRNQKATGAGRDGMEGATRPWIEAALARGYHEVDGDEPVTPEAVEWMGWGTALKPAFEPVIVARMPLAGTVAETVLKHGTGAINIDACRVSYAGEADKAAAAAAAAAAAQRSCHDTPGRVRWGGGESSCFQDPEGSLATFQANQDKGRWPANVIHDGSAEVVEAFPREAGAFAPVRGDEPSGLVREVYGERERVRGAFHGDSGSAARFFYTAKADAGDRLGTKHPTVKPVDLIAYLARLATRPGGLVLDPFAGSGTTGAACMREGFDAVLIEREADYVADIRRRLDHAQGLDAPLFAGVAD
jgi:DNA modification methylase